MKDEEDEHFDTAPFLMLDKKLLEASHWISPKTGEVIPFPLIDKIVYLVMRDKWLFYVKRLGNTFHESQESIAKSCGTFRRKVNEVVKRFIQEGVIEAHKVKVDNGVSLVYDEIFPISVLVEGKRKVVGKIRQGEDMSDDSPPF